MFPSRDLPAIIDGNNTAPTESASEKKSIKKKTFPITISSHQFTTLACVALILLIIALAIFIGLLSVFVPKSDDNNRIDSTVETVVVTLVLPITEDSSHILSLTNGSLMVDSYLNHAQRNMLNACLQTQLNAENMTSAMTILSVDSARGQYSNSPTKKRQRRHPGRMRRQTSSVADQVEMVVSIQCRPFTSKADCHQVIKSVLDNGQSPRCSLTDLIIATFRTTTTKKVVTITKIHHWRQVGQIFLAFGLTSLVGLERRLRGKSAGLRTHSIVGTTSALILQVSKYGFSDVVHQSMVVLDPSRIAAQIISGISFLGAGLIITRQAAIRGLTTAASVWSAAAIGMAAGSGLWVLSLAVTGFHFVILLGFSPLEKRLPVFGAKFPFNAKADDDGEEEDDEDTHSV